MTSRDDVLYLYNSAVVMIQQALDLTQVSKLRLRLLEAAVALLLELTRSDALRALNLHNAAQITLCEVLIRHTNSGHLAQEIYTQALLSGALTPTEQLRLRLLEMEYLIKIGNVEEALRVNNECTPLLQEVSDPSLSVAFTFLKLQMGPVSDEELTGIENFESPMLRLLSEVSQPVSNKVLGYKKSEVGPAGESLQVLHNIKVVLSRGLRDEEEEDDKMVETIRAIDWDEEFWNSGVMSFAHNGDSFQVQWLNKREITHICYLFLVTLHLSTETSEYGATQAWLDELMASLGDEGASQSIISVVYFYLCAVYHACSRPKVAKVVLDQFRKKMGHRRPSSHEVMMLEYCEALCAQSDGDIDSARSRYTAALTHDHAPIRAACLINLLTTDMHSEKTRSELDDIAMGGDKAVSDSYALLKALGYKNELPMNEYQELLTHLFETKMATALQDALVKMLSPLVHNVTHESKVNCLSSAIGSFQNLRLNDWTAYCERQLSHVQVSGSGSEPRACCKQPDWRLWCEV